jgi:hypothetical protein
LALKHTGKVIPGCWRLNRILCSYLSSVRMSLMVRTTRRQILLLFLLVTT